MESQFNAQTWTDRKLSSELTSSRRKKHTPTIHGTETINHANFCAGEKQLCRGEVPSVVCRCCAESVGTQIWFWEKVISSDGSSKQLCTCRCAAQSSTKRVKFRIPKRYTIEPTWMPKATKNEIKGMGMLKPLSFRQQQCTNVFSAQGPNLG